MYTVIKRMEISAAHSLKLSYRSKCEDLHVTIGLSQSTAVPGNSMPMEW